METNDMARPTDRVLSPSATEPHGVSAHSGDAPSRWLLALSSIHNFSHKTTYQELGAGYCLTLILAHAKDALASLEAARIRDSDRNPEGEDRNGLRAEHESAGRQASPTQSIQEPTNGN